MPQIGQPTTAAPYGRTNTILRIDGTRVTRRGKGRVCLLCRGDSTPSNPSRAGKLLYGYGLYALPLPLLAETPYFPTEKNVLRLFASPLRLPYSLHHYPSRHLDGWESDARYPYALRGSRGEGKGVEVQASIAPGRPIYLVEEYQIPSVQRDEFALWYYDIPFPTARVLDARYDWFVGLARPQPIAMHPRIVDLQDWTVRSTPEWGLGRILEPYSPPEPPEPPEPPTPPIIPGDAHGDAAQLEFAAYDGTRESGIVQFTRADIQAGTNVDNDSTRAYGDQYFSLSYFTGTSLSGGSVTPMNLSSQFGGDNNAFGTYDYGTANGFQVYSTGNGLGTFFGWRVYRPANATSISASGSFAGSTSTWSSGSAYYDWQVDFFDGTATTTIDSGTILATVSGGLTSVTGDTTLSIPPQAFENPTAYLQVFWRVRDNVGGSSNPASHVNIYDGGITYFITLAV